MNYVRFQRNFDARNYRDVLGVTFKPETDDLCDFPAMSILLLLHEKGAKLQVHDSQGMEEAEAIFPELTFCANAYDACRDADTIFLLTEWNQYRALGVKIVSSVMSGAVFVDLRNVYEPKK